MIKEMRNCARRPGSHYDAGLLCQNRMAAAMRRMLGLKTTVRMGRRPDEKEA